EPKTTSLFLGLTRLRAKELCWGPLKEAAEDAGIQLEFNDSDLIATNRATGSRVLLGGCDNKKEADKYRGSKYHLVCIDEAAFYGDHLEYLIEEVLSPALLDYAGTLVLASTPNRTATGYFFDITDGGKGEQWQTWKWTVKDNPKLPLWDGDPNWKDQVEELLEFERKLKGWDEDTPAYRREFLAEWVRDGESQVLDFTDENLVDMNQISAMDLQYIIGVDSGYVDAMAIVVGGFSRRDGVLYIVEAIAIPGL